MKTRRPDDVFAELGQIFDERLQLDNLSGATPAQDTIPSLEGADPSAPNAVAGPGQQVAMGGAARAGTRGLEKIIGKVTKPRGPDPLQVEQLDTILQQYAEEPLQTEKRSADRNINIERHHPGAQPEMLEGMSPDMMMMEMKTADDIGKLLEVVGRHDQLQEPPRTHDTVKKRSEDLEALRPVAEGKQIGLLNDVQLHAARRLLTTIGERTVELANMIAAGNQTPELLLQYQQSGEQFRAIQQFVSGQVREVARALSQQRMVSESLNSLSGVMMDDALTGAAGSVEQVVRHAQMITRKMQDPNADLGVLSKSLDDRWRRGIGLLLEYWKSNILSGPQTHAVNITSNMAMNVWANAVVQPMAGVVGATRRAVTGANDGVYLDESVERMAALVPATMDAFRLGWRSLYTGEQLLGGSKTEQRSHMAEFGAEMGGRAGEVAGTVMTMPLRLLSAEDEAFKAFAMMQEIPALAMRAGKERGLEGDALRKFVDETVEDPPKELFDAAFARAQELTFTNSPHGPLFEALNEAAQTLVAKVPAFSFVAPFIKTPANLGSRALEMSAIAPLMGMLPNTHLGKKIRAGGADFDEAVAKMVTGVALSAVFWQLFEEGHLTGGGPDNYHLYKNYEKLGERPYSLRIGNTYYSLDRLDPFGLSLSMIADMLFDFKYARTDKAAENYYWMMTMHMADNLLNATYAQGIGDLFDAIRMQGTKPASMAANIVTGLVPYSAALNTARKFVDPQPRRKSMDPNVVRGFGQRVKQSLFNRLPGFSDSLRPGRYWDGEVMKPEGGRVVYSLSPMQLGRGRRDLATEQLIKNGVAVRDPSPLVTWPPSRRGGIKHSLVELDDGVGEVYDRYIEQVGKERREFLSKFLRNPPSAYTDAPEGYEGERYRMLTRELRNAQRKATAEFYRDILPQMVEANPENKSDIAIHLARNASNFFEEARSYMLPEEQQKKVRVVGQEQQSLPLPPHIEEQEAGELRF